VALGRPSMPGRSNRMIQSCSSGATRLKGFLTSLSSCDPVPIPSLPASFVGIVDGHELPRLFASGCILSQQWFVLVPLISSWGKMAILHSPRLAARAAALSCRFKFFTFTSTFHTTSCKWDKYPTGALPGPRAALPDIEVDFCA
jgi:hypothetical protein